MINIQLYEISFVRGSAKMWSGLFVGCPTCTEVWDALQQGKELCDDYRIYSVNILDACGVPSKVGFLNYKVDGIVIGAILMESSVGYLTKACKVTA